MKKIIEGQPVTQKIATGLLALSNEEAIKLADAGNEVVLCKRFTTPDDTIAIMKCVGLITIAGGLASHASIIARETNKACIINCEIEIKAEAIVCGKTVVPAQSKICVDGFTGSVFLK